MAKTKFINNASVRGYVFSHKLRVADSSKNPGERVIFGTLNVATDDNAINVVPVSFFVNEKWKTGKKNTSYANLSQIINENKTVETVGIANAARVRIDGSVDVNEYYNRDGQLVSGKRVSGSFIHFLNPGEQIETPTLPATSFETDMLIQSVTEKESQDDESTYVSLRGFVFNYRGDVEPVTFSVESDSGKDFFLGEDISASNPYFGKVWGRIKTSVVVSKHEEDGSNTAFGAPQVRETNRSYRIWEVVGANTNDGMSEETITQEELAKLVAEHQARLAGLAEKAGQRSVSAPTGFAASAAPASQASSTGFNYDDIPF